MKQTERCCMQVVQHLKPGGIETLTLDLLNHADETEHMLIVSLEGSRTRALADWPTLRPFADQLHFLDKRPGWRPGLIWQLRQLMRELNVNSVHTHHIGPLIYGGIAARLAGIGNRLHTEHDAWHLSRSRRRRLQGMVLRVVAPQLVADADIVAESIRGYWPRLETRVIRNGIDTHRFVPGDSRLARSRLGLPQQVKLIGCSGRLEAIKGQDVLIESTSRLPANIHLAIAGSGRREKQLRKQVRDLALEKRVHFLGHIDDMPLFYQSIDLFCQPSHQEGLPLAPLEAQACNVPVVATNVGGSREALCPTTGRLVPRGDVGRMTSQLLASLTERAGSEPRDFVKRHGDVRQMARSYAALRRPCHVPGV
jgi:glycosyltransferase involved in cell wall biosynthesis